MNKAHSPAAVRRPFARYSHGVEVEVGSRMLFTSGQLGISVNDEVPDDAGAQAELCFRAIGAILADADMDFGDIVRINAYVTDRAVMKAYMDVRDRFVREPPPASTLMIVSGFTREEFKVEVEIVAAAKG